MSERPPRRLLVSVCAAFALLTATAYAQTSTTTSLTSSPNPSTLGENVTLTATVLPAAAAGSVQFFDSSTPLGAPVGVSLGTAALSIDTLGLGSHPLAAQFTPTDPSSFSGSTSAAVIQIVNPASTTTTTTT